MPEETPFEASGRRRGLELPVSAALLALFLGVSLWIHWDDLPDKDVIGVIVAAGLTLTMYSFLYRDNPVFKAVENLYVGVALGYTIIRITWYLTLKPEVVDPIVFAPSYEAMWYELGRRIVPITLGFMLLTRVSKRFSWPSRYSYALMIGWGAGIGIPLTINSQILEQIEAAVASLYTPQASASGLDIAIGVLGGLAIMVGTVSVLYYFFFSLKRKRFGKVVSRIGIIFLMVSFGASFGYTVMGRISLLIGRMQFLLYDWLTLDKPT